MCTNNYLKMNFWQDSETEASFNEEEVIERFKIYANELRHEEVEENNKRELNEHDIVENYHKQDVELDKEQPYISNPTNEESNNSPPKDTYGFCKEKLLPLYSEHIDPHNLIKPPKKKVYLDKNKLKDGLTQEEISLRAMQRIKEFEQKEKEVKDNLLKLLNKGNSK